MTDHSPTLVRLHLVPLMSITLVLVLGLFTGCGEDDTVGPDVLTQLSQGWDSYEVADYAAALLSFERVVSQAPELADAHNGLGWSRLSSSQELTVNPHLIESAMDAFQESLRRDSDHADAWVGLATALFLRRQSTRDYVQAIEALANAEVRASSTWLYRHDYSNRSDLLALKANCYYYLGDIGAASSAVAEALDLRPDQKTASRLQRILAGS